MFTIGTRKIGPDQPVFVIAELSANHGQNLEHAIRLVHAAADAGADAVKLQTYTGATLTLDSDLPWFQIGGGTAWDGQRLYDLYEQAHLPWDWHPRLQAEAKACDLELFSSPFDDSAIRFLESLQVPAYKIASFEIVDHELLADVAQTGKPVIVSTGMATVEEIGQALTTLREHGATDVALLKCTSAYPAPPENMNLRTIQDLQTRFGVPIGLSDHTLGIESAVVAVSLGAVIVEKHLTLSRAAGGPDAGFSLEPAEFRQLVDSIRTAEAALGSIQYGASPSERNHRSFRRSLFAVRDIGPGERFTRDNVRSIRPGDGLPPSRLPEVLQARATMAIPRGTPLQSAHLGPCGEVAEMSLTRVPGV